MMCQTIEKLFGHKLQAMPKAVGNDSEVMEVLVPRKTSAKGGAKKSKSMSQPTSTLPPSQSTVTSQTVLPPSSVVSSPPTTAVAPTTIPNVPSPLVTSQMVGSTTATTVVPGGPITPTPTQQKARRGVKRQADTTTPSGQPSPSWATPTITPMITPLPQPLVPQRSGSTRQVKRPKMDLPGENSYPSSGLPLAYLVPTSPPAAASCSASDRGSPSSCSLPSSLHELAAVLGTKGGEESFDAPGFCCAGLDLKDLEDAARPSNSGVYNPFESDDNASVGSFGGVEFQEQSSDSSAG